jgi:protein-arginine kinase activator protein McsA
LEALRAQLAEAVSREDYEEAGRLRDSIRALEEERAAERSRQERDAGDGTT